MLGWLIALELLNLGLILATFLTLRKNSSRLDRVVRQNRARQSKIVADRVYQARPDIDSRARTTRRDTEDLPRTGRQSRVAQSRQGGDLFDRVDHDRGLQQGAGSPAAQVGEDSGQAPGEHPPEDRGWEATDT